MTTDPSDHEDDFRGVGGSSPVEPVHRLRPRTGILGALVAVLALTAAGLLGAWLAAPNAPGERSVDAGFLRDMSTHHGQAVEMSMIVRTTSESVDVLSLSYDIATTQENQRGMMSGWLQQWGRSQALQGAPMEWMAGTGHQHAGAPAGSMLLPDGRMPGMASDAEMRALRTAKGREAEVLYLQLMIDHHTAGVEMAEAARASASSPLVQRLAGTMVEGQKSEIDLMTSMLRRRGAQPRPQA